MRIETVSIEELKDNIRQAIETLLEQDIYLLNRDAREEAISSRLARYLETLFEGWDVDCEFDREGDKQKKTPLPQKQNPETPKDTLVRPDIIVHKRGTSDNLLAIEVKKSSNRNQADFAHDRMKIESYVNNHLRYRIGAFIIIRTDKSMNEQYRIDWYEHGTWTSGGV